MIQLVKRSISGDADAFLELMEKNSLAMYKVARGKLADGTFTNTEESGIFQNLDDPYPDQ